MIKENSKLLSFCGHYVRNTDPDRFFCALFIAPSYREHYFRLLAFYNEITRAVTLSSSWNVAGPMAGYIRLQWWRDLLAGRPDRAHEIEPYLKDSLKHNFLSEDSLLTLIKAREEELDGIKDWNHWHSLMNRTAGQIQKIMATILRVKKTEQVDLIISLGIAYEIVYIAKNLPGILRKGRFPLPIEIYNQFDGRRSEQGIDFTSSSLSEIRKMLKEKAVDYFYKNKLNNGIDRQYKSLILPAFLAQRDLKSSNCWDFLPKKRGFNDKMAIVRANYFGKLKLH